VREWSGLEVKAFRQRPDAEWMMAAIEALAFDSARSVAAAADDQ